MRLMLPLAIVACVVSLALAVPARAEDLAFKDGRQWMGVRILSRGQHDVVVMQAGNVVTVRAADLTDACARALQIRSPTPEEIAARAADEARRVEAAKEREAAAAVETARLQNEANQRRQREQKLRADQAVAMAGRRYLVGTILQRLPNGALVLARDVPVRWAGSTQAVGGGSPAAAPQIEEPVASLPRVVGTIFVPEHPALAGKFKDSVVRGVVYPAGEYSYTNVMGADHRIAAWSLSP